MGILIDWLIYVLLIWGLVKGLNATAFKREPASRMIAWTLTICMFFVNLIALTLVQAIQYKMLSQGLGVDIKPRNAANITGAFTATWIFFVLLRKSPKNTKANSHTSTISSLIARFTTTDTSTTDATYEKIDQELKTDNLDRATWTRAQGDAEGNAERAKALYIKYRAQRLLAASRDDSANQLSVDAVSVEKPAKTYNSRVVAATVGILAVVVAVIVIGFLTEKPAPTTAATGGGNVFDQFDTEKPAPTKDTASGGNPYERFVAEKPAPAITLVPVDGDPFHPIPQTDRVEIDAKSNARAIEQETKLLEKAYPNWRTIVGTPGSKTVFRIWLAKQDNAYQSLLSTTNSAAIIADSIERFKAETAKSALPAPFAPHSTTQTRPSQ